jgi:divalent metal cation (Fe/Co/Zn/Cd) transporter
VQEGFDVLMDKSLEPDMVDRVTAVLRACTSIDSFHDLRTRRGQFPSVDFHAVVDSDTTARELHDLYDDLRVKIRAIVGPTTRVEMHADPSTGPNSDPPPQPRV